MVGQTIQPSSLAGSIEDNLKEVAHDHRYQSELVEIGDGHTLAWSSYPSYPTAEYGINDRSVWVEGCIYNHTNETLHELLSTVVDGVEREDFNQLNDTLVNADGEFIITFATDDGDVVVITDWMCQLPLSYHEPSGLLTRDQILIPKLMNVGINSLGAACYLLWGYPINNRTLFEDTYRVPPAAVVTIGASEITVDQYHDHDFSGEAHQDNSKVENAKQLAQLFRAACKRRADQSPGRSILLLSGGWDSRAVLGGLIAEKCEFVAATRNQPELDSQRDIRTAEKLAEVFDIQWNEYIINKPTSETFNRHIRMKAGADPLSIAHILPFFDELRKEYSTATFFTGDAGDKLIAPVKPHRPVTSQADLIKCLIESANRLPMDDVTALTEVTREEIERELAGLIMDYPGDNGTDQYVHFQITERLFSWLIEAEDTDRCFHWTTSPFMSPGVFMYALNVPLSQKTRYHFYQSFLEAIDPRLIVVESGNTGSKLGSINHEASVIAYQLISRYPWVANRVKPIAKRALGHTSDREVNYPVNIPRAVTSLNGILDDTAATAILKDGSYNYNQRYQLLTLALIAQIAAEH